MTWTRFLFLALLAVAAGGYYYWTERREPPAERYRTMAADRGPIVKTVAANGTLNPVVLVNVGTQVSGTVQRLHADFNDRVRSGQVLAELDPALFRAALDQSRSNLANAEASLRLAEANEARAQEIHAKGYIARAELDQAVQALASARAQVAAAAAAVRRDETNLRNSVIVSPVSGIVVSRNVDVGQTVAASFQTPTLFIIAQDLKRMQIDTTVAEADVGGVRVGQAVTFTVDAFPGREFRGRVRQIRLNSQVLQNVVTYNVVIDVANPEQILLPGMTAFVNIVVAERRDVLRIPVAALRYRPEPAEDAPGRRAAPPAEPPKTFASGNLKTVYRLQGQQAEPVTVQLGLSDGKFAEVLGSTLAPGDALIVEDLSAKKTEAGTGGGQFRVRMF